MNLNFFSAVKGLLKPSKASATSNTKNGTGKEPETETQKKLKKTKKITEPIASDISVSPSLVIPPPEPSTKSLQEPPIEQSNPIVIDQKKTHRFTTDETMQIIDWISQFKKDKEISNLIFENFGKTLKSKQIQRYRFSDKWQPIIQKNRQRYASQMFQVEYANERRRIETLQKLVNKCLRNGNDSLAVKAIHEINEQLKKNEPTVQNNYQVNVYKEMTEEEFDKRELELIQKRKQLKGEI